MSAPPPPPARGGMSLYANLLDPGGQSNPGVSSSNAGPGNQEEDAPKKLLDSALRFQPIRRPQAKPANKPKAAFPKAPPAALPAATATPSNNNGNGATGSSTAQQQPRSTLADWAATEEDEYLYGAPNDRRQRGGRRKKKKKAEDQLRETDWDELYDPSRPTNFEEYMRSDERIRAAREWRDLLYAHRRRDTRRSSRSYGSDEGSDEELDHRTMGNQFAPPSSLNFAPPSFSPSHAAPSAPIPDDVTGDDAYARRLALSGMAPPSALPSMSSPSPPPPPPPQPNAATISRAPVRYSPLPAAAPENTTPMDLDDDEDASATPPDDQNDDGPRSSRPGQKGFAARLMAKYGWKSGTGLGASNTGITSALRVQVEKRKRKADAEGGGFATPAGMGKIIPGKQNKRTKMEDDAKGDDDGSGGGGDGENQGFGKMSVVIVLRNMLEGMDDLAAEIEAGLGQEIGEECGDKYGRVERLYVDVVGRRVFIKFVEAVSALRAVNALEGRVFNGNAIMARFYDADKFEEGVYE